MLTKWTFELLISVQHICPTEAADACRTLPTVTSAYLVLSFFACWVQRRERLSAKQQEGRAMATLDRQIPSPDTFLHKPWSSFVSAAKLRFVDSKLARRWGGCVCLQSVGKCVLQLSVIELSKLLHHAGSVKDQQSNCQNITTKCRICGALFDSRARAGAHATDS